MNTLIGTCSWTDKTLLSSEHFYPRLTMTAEERLHFYTTRFPTVEVDSSFYGMLSERNARLWVERTPAQFIFNIKAYRTLTGHDRSRPASEEEWRSFRHALQPLQEAQKLGYVLFQFPSWFQPERKSIAYLRECRERIPEVHLAIQFRHGSWVTGPQLPDTLQLLSKEGLHYVCVDEPQLPGGHTVPPVGLVTAGVGIIRFNGRNAANWHAKGVPVVERFHYRYQTEELMTWAARIKELQKQSSSFFVMFNNCFADDAVVNAQQIASLLRIPLPADDMPVQQSLFEMS